MQWEADNRGYSTAPYIAERLAKHVMETQFADPDSYVPAIQLRELDTSWNTTADNFFHWARRTPMGNWGSLLMQHGLSRLFTLYSVSGWPILELAHLFDSINASNSAWVKRLSSCSFWKWTRILFLANRHRFCGVVPYAVSNKDCMVTFPARYKAINCFSLLGEWSWTWSYRSKRCKMYFSNSNLDWPTMAAPWQGRMILGLSASKYSVDSR